MTPLVQALNMALLHFIWQGIAVGLLLWITLLLLRRKSANVRYVTSCSALALLALAPVVTAWSSYVPQGEARLSWKSITSIVEPQGLGSLAVEPAGIVSGWQILEAWILPAWALGVALFALRLIWCWGHTSALRRTGTPAGNIFLAMVSRAADRIGVTRRISVLMSSVTDVPSVIGWVRPVLLLPVSVATGLPPEQLEALVAHELAHIRRHDYLVNLVQTVVETVLFYHPVVWWVSSKIRFERELCCDDLAVAAIGDATCYARALARLEEVRALRPSLAMGAARGPLFHRIERLLGGDGLQQGPSRLACAIGLIAGLACLALSMGSAEGRQAAQSNSGTPRVEYFFPPLPPVPPVVPLPPAQEIAPIPPMPPVPPEPVFASLSSIVQEALQRVVQSTEDVPWVLFRGDRVISNASSADEKDARAARQSSGGGDTLWFRLEGKAYLAQDKAILDRAEFGFEQILGTRDFLSQAEQNAVGALLESQAQQRRLQAELQANLAAIQAQVSKTNNSENAAGALLEFQAQQRRLQAELQANLAAIQAQVSKTNNSENAAGALLEFQAQQRRLQAELQANLAAIQAQVSKANNSVEDVAAVRRELEELRLRLATMAAKLHEREVADVEVNRAAERAADLRLKAAEAARQRVSRLPDLLRDSVSSGKARPVQ